MAQKVVSQTFNKTKYEKRLLLWFTIRVQSLYEIKLHIVVLLTSHPCKKIAIAFKGCSHWRRAEIFIRSIQSSWILRNEDTICLRTWFPFVAVTPYHYTWENLGDSLFQLNCKKLQGYKAQNEIKISSQHYSYAYFMPPR